MGDIIPHLVVIHKFHQDKEGDVVNRRKNYVRMMMQTATGSAVQSVTPTLMQTARTEGVVLQRLSVTPILIQTARTGSAVLQCLCVTPTLIKTARTGNAVLQCLCVTLTLMQTARTGGAAVLQRLSV